VVADAESEDDAHRLAEEIRQYAPSGAEVHAERADTPLYFGGGFGGRLAGFPKLVTAGHFVGQLRAKGHDVTLGRLARVR
jgi:hypothetical protein